MADIMETIQTYLRAQSVLSTWHIGEVIPEGTTKPYVYLIRSGENVSEDLGNLIDIDGITVDVECVANEIDACRLGTRQVKWLLRGYPQHSQTFDDDFGVERTIHGFMVEDHDDSYIPRALENDDKVHVGALSVTVLYGGSNEAIGPGPE
jgi:hypothetical protein